jgi:hypothetical protein
LSGAYQAKKKIDLIDFIKEWIKQDKGNATRRTFQIRRQQRRLGRQERLVGKKLEEAMLKDQDKETIDNLVYKFNRFSDFLCFLFRMSTNS